MNLNELEKTGARYVTFSCNAYSTGALSPNLMVGWMNSAYPMTVSDKDGVAYDPSCVQFMVRVSEANLSRDDLVVLIPELGHAELGAQDALDDSFAVVHLGPHGSLISMSTPAGRSRRISTQTANSIL